MVKNTKGGSSHKKLARKKENDNEVLHINLNLNFKTENIIVLVEKNMGNCFSAKLLHCAGPTDNFKTELKVLHQRGRRGKSNFDHAASRVALVSLISGIRLDNNCIGVVEEFLGSGHLLAYLNNNLIDKAVYDKINANFSAIDNSKVEKDLGYEFDRGNNDDEEEEKEDKNGLDKMYQNVINVPNTTDATNKTNDDIEFDFI